MIQALSWALKEQVTFDDRIVTSHDWVTYPILTFLQVPEIDVVILDRPGPARQRHREPVTVPVAAALANAIYDATGVRVRDSRSRLERMAAALADA